MTKALYKTRFRPTQAGLLEATAADMWASEHIKHVNAEWYGKPFDTEDWQFSHLWAPVFGDVGAKVRHKFGSYLFMLPREHGKSEMAARIVITHATLYPSMSAEYAIFASSKQQARIIYDKVSAMIRLDPTLSALWLVQKKDIVNRQTGSSIVVMPAEEAEAQGHHYTIAIVDEAHVIKKSNLVTAIQSGMLHNPDSKLIIITTAGSERKGYLYDELLPRYKSEADHYLYWIGAAESDNPADRSCWDKAMVAGWLNYDVLEQAYKALTPEAFMRYHLNQFPAYDMARESAFSDDDLAKVVVARKEWDWSGRLVLGVDGAQRGDNFALVFARRDDDGRLGLYPIIYDKADDDTGYYDLALIEETIAESWASHQVVHIVIDPSRLLLMAAHLKEQRGLELEKFEQTNKLMCPACVYLTNEVMDGRVRVYGPHAHKFIGHLRNCVKKEAEPFGFRFTKDFLGSPHKIDAAIAASMAAIKLDTLPDSPSSEVYFI